MKNLGFILLLTLGLFSCDMKDSYTVRIGNSTGEDLTIAYKSNNDLKGVVEETIRLKDGDFKVIISTGDFEVLEGNTGDGPKPCEFVAEYIRASIRGNVESNIKWCDPAIKIETADIGQKEFIINYRLSDFGVE